MGKMRQEEMMRQQVLILYHGSLLAQGIESLLRKEQGLDVVGVQLGKGRGDSHSEELDPDAIIVDSCDLAGRGTISILALLKEHPKAKVICLNPEDDTVDVYRKDHRVATGREELVEAICSN